MRVEDVLWQSAFPPSRGGHHAPFPEGSHEIFGEREAWLEAADAIDSGARVVAGISLADVEDGKLATDFILQVEPQGVAFFGEAPWAERDTSMFNTFFSWEGNPLGDTSPIELLEAWNREGDARPGAPRREGPIERSWDRFWGLYVDMTDYPWPGSEARWTEAPPQCRTLSDAPEPVIDGLLPVFLWIDVPAGWRSMSDGALCLRISIASLECLSDRLLRERTPIAIDDAYSVPGEPISLVVAKMQGEIPSWIHEVLIGTIDPEAIEPTGLSLVSWIPATRTRRTPR